MNELALTGGLPIRDAPYPTWPAWDESEEHLLSEVLKSGRWWATQGTKVRAFEEAWAQYCEVGSAIAVTNGTHALEVALTGVDVGDGDEVIVPDYSFLASASAVAYVNARPVLVDIDPDTFCIDPAAVEAAITSRTRAVVAVHLAGHPVDLDRLTDICRRNDLRLIEDCAHAHGSAWNGQRVGSFGDAGTFSFQQSKLMTAGEGGAIVARNEDTANRIRSFSDCGRKPNEWFYDHFLLGGNFRMTEWQAAILLAQLARFPEQHENRNRNAIWLNQELARIPGVYPQKRDPRTTSQGYFCYVVRIDEDEFGADRDAIRKALIAEGIPLTMSYPPIHELATFQDSNGFAPRYRSRGGWQDVKSADLPNTRRAAATTLWFNHQMLMGTRDDAADVVDAMEKIHRHSAVIANVR